MKKNSLALTLFATCAAFAGAAHAQTEQTVQTAPSGSSVSIYGLLETSVSRVNGGTTTLSNTSATGAGGFAKPGLTSINGLGSRIGFMGSEDLGGGLKAKFQLEQRFTPDTGASTVAGSSFAGRSVVGMDTPYGEVLIGRNYVPAYYVANLADPFAFDNSVAGLGAGHTFAGYAGNAAGSSIRMDNSIAYTSPVFMQGLTVSLAKAPNENASGTNSGSYGMNGIYKKEALKLAYGYDRRGDGSNLNIAAASYDLGSVTPIASYSRGVASNIRLNAVTTNYAIGATTEFRGGMVKAVYALLNQTSTGTKTSKLGLGYEYSMSKRTSVFTDLATGRTDNMSRTTGVDAGIRHRF